MMAILPNQIPPIETPVLSGTRFEKNWWLFLYNISSQVLGNQSTTAAAFAANAFAELDAQADDSYLLTLIKRVEALEKQFLDSLPDPLDPRALLLAQDGLLPDVALRAQPVQILSVGVSPWVYTAPFDGSVTVTGGTVSALGLSRDSGVTFYAVSGVIPVSRLDRVQVTYSALPSAQFFPR